MQQLERRPGPNLDVRADLLHHWQIETVELLLAVHGQCSEAKSALSQNKLLVRFAGRGHIGRSRAELAFDLLKPSKCCSGRHFAAARESRTRNGLC